MKIRIEKAIYGGSGLARIGDGELTGKTAFVPYTLPNELVEAHIVEDKSSFFQAEVDAVLEASPQRIDPACPYFGSCGGCSYQHADYAFQVEMKTAILRETLLRAGLSNPPSIKTLSGERWSYRNRVRLHLQRTPFALGYRERRSDKLVAVHKCPIAAPVVEKAIAAVTEAGDSLGLTGLCDEIELFSGDDDSLLLSLIKEGPGKGLGQRSQSGLEEICRALQQHLPELQGAGLFSIRGKQPARLLHIWGDGSQMYKAAGHDYQVSLGSFFQVNRFLIDPLVELVVGDRKGRIAWDLYAGVGLFSRALAERFERVIAVESSPASCSDLRRNLRDTSHRAIEASTLDFLQKQKPAGTPPDLVVVDPPRSGLGAAITMRMAQIGPPEIVYVSCDPSTLSRDLAALVQSGYDLRTITMVDMFPQTFHLESVSVLTRR